MSVHADIVVDVFQFFSLSRFFFSLWPCLCFCKFRPHTLLNTGRRLRDIGTDVRATHPSDLQGDSKRVRDKGLQLIAEVAGHQGINFTEVAGH
jgi:hypothetical protein